MDQGKKGIPFDMFKVQYLAGVRYTGDVQDFGYVYWNKKTVPVDFPDDFPIDTPFKRTYVDVYSMHIMRYPTSGMIFFGDNLTEEQKESNKKANDADEVFRLFMVSLLTAVNTANSVYGSYKTYQSASKVAVTLGAEYNVVNKAGTLVKNTNRVTTTKGKIADNVSIRLAVIGVFIDALLTGIKNSEPNISNKEYEKNLINWGLNTAVSAGLYVVGTFCAPLSAALGLTYLVFSIFSETGNHPLETDYVKIHGTIAPAVSTKVHNPYKRKQ